MSLVLKMAAYNRRVSLFCISEDRASNHCAKCALHTVSHRIALVCWLLCTLLTLSHGTTSTCWLVHFAYTITRNHLDMLTCALCIHYHTEPPQHADLCTLQTLSHATTSTCWLVYFAYTITRNHLDVLTYALCIRYHVEPPRHADLCTLHTLPHGTTSTSWLVHFAYTITWNHLGMLNFVGYFGNNPEHDPQLRQKHKRARTLGFARAHFSPHACLYHESDQSSPCPPPPIRLLLRPSALLRPYQTIGSSPRPCEMFHNRVIFYTEGLSAPP